MVMTKLHWVALVLAAFAFVAGMTVGWVWSCPFTLASFACSVAAVVKVRRDRRAVEIAIRETEWLPSSSIRGRRAFEPFCDCPRCGVPTFHVLGAPREELDGDLVSQRWMMGVGEVWMANYEMVSVWNSERTYRVRHLEEDAAEAEPTFVTVVDRECLSCEHKWTEKAS